MIDMNPLAKLHSVAIDRDSLFRQGMTNHGRDKFFCRLVRPEDVYTPSGDHMHIESVRVGLSEKLLSALGRAIDRPAFERLTFLVERSFLKASSDLIC